MTLKDIDKSDNTTLPTTKKKLLGRLWDLIHLRHVRLTVQVLLVLALNLTIIGGIISALLPIIRLDLPWLSRGELRLCPLATYQRAFTWSWGIGLFILTLGIMIIICILIGRLLCAWACPFGLFQDLLTKLRGIFRINKREFKLKTHKRLGALRFSILFFAMLFSLSIGLSFFTYWVAGDLYSSYLPAGTVRVAPFCSICPTPTLYYVLTVFQTSDLQFSDPTHYVMWGILGIFVVGGFLIPRLWCRYLCPVGAMSSLFNPVSLLKIHKDIPKCTKCNYCVSNCPMRVEKVRDEDRDARVSNSECTFCLDCVEKCPEKVLSLRLANITIYKGEEWWAKWKK